MENASKALLIAGAILLVIAIIAIAVGIVSSTRGTIGVAENQVDTMGVKMHNEQFLKYEGVAKSMQDAKDLLVLIAKNNSTGQNMIIVHEHLQDNDDDKNKYVASWHFESDYTTNAYSQYSGSYFNGKPITIGSDKNTGNVFNIKFRYNTNGIIDRVDFYRYYN